MEDIGDDFGDLYADVEAQAGSAINGGRDFTRLYTEPGEQDDEDSDSNRPNPNPSSEDGFDDLTEESNENDDNRSDSEDDLNIVLNDGDCEGKTFPIMDQVVDVKNEEDKDGFAAIKEEEKVKYIRTHGSSIPSDVKANASALVLARCDWNSNVCGRRKGPSSGHNDLVGATRISVMTQSRCGFSLPWYRSILDVNIDTFEEKPWRYPGVDVTDFFNFGFNEDSWRQYCNSLEQLRWPSFGESGNSNHVSRNQDYEAGSNYDEGFEETMVDNVDQPKGRAIQVEDGSGERQPSVDVRRPRDRDSDVVIQITLEDPIEDTSDTGEKLNHSGSTECGTCNNEEFEATDCNGGRGDEFSIESLEENDKNKDRCYAKITSSNPMTNDPDDTETNQSPDVNGNRHEETCAFSSDGTTELPESVNKTRESVILRASCADKYMVETELSLEEEGKLSLTSSCFASDSEASSDDSHLDRGKVTSPIRRSSVKSGGELWDSDSPRPKNLQGNYAKIKPVDFRDYSKCKSPVQGERKHRTRSVDSHAQRKINIYGNDTSPGLDAEDMYDKGRLSADYGRWKENMEDVNFTDREDLTYYEKSKQSHYYRSREFAKDHTHTARKNYRNRSKDFHEGKDPYVVQNCKKRGYLCEDDRREGYQYRRGPFSGDMPPVYKETEQLVSRYSATSEQIDFRSKRKNNRLQFMKPNNHSSRFPDYELDGTDFMREKNARSVSLVNWKRDTLDESYERQVPKRRKEVKNSAWKRCNDAFSLELEGACSRELEDEETELEGSWSRKMEDEYWGNTDVHHLSRHSHRESDGGSWTDPMPPRNGASLSRFVERYRRQLPAGEGKESGWLENYNDLHKFEDGFIYRDNEVHFRRERRCGWKSEVLPWMEEEPTIRHRYEKLNFKKSSFLCKNYGRHRRNQSTHGTLHDAMHIDDMQADKHGYRIIKDGSYSRGIYRSQKMFRAKNEQAFLRCRDSLNLFVGEGKLSRRRPTDRNLSFHSRLEDTYIEDINESSRYEAVQSNVPKVGLNLSNEDFHDQFPLAARNEDFDIEEGQIVTEELYTGPSERTHDSVSAACTESVKKRMLEYDLASHGSKTGGQCDDQWILETLAKMERRRERFKEPIALKREQDKCAKPDIVPAPTIVETTETKQHRPARKRQWCTGQS